MVSATRAAKHPDWAFVPLGAMFLSLSDLWRMSKPVKKSASFFVFSGHTWNMSKPVMTFVFKVLRNRLLRYRLETCPNLWWRSCSKCYAIDCFGIHTWNMSKPVMTFVFKVLRNRLLRYNLETCPNLWWRSCSKCYASDCFGTYLKHVLGRVCSATLWNDVYLVHNDEIPMGTAWFRARATKDPKRGCLI